MISVFVMWIIYVIFRFFYTLIKRVSHFVSCRALSLCCPLVMSGDSSTGLRNVVVSKNIVCQQVLIFVFQVLKTSDLTKQTNNQRNKQLKKSPTAQKENTQYGVLKNNATCMCKYSLYSTSRLVHNQYSLFTVQCPLCFQHLMFPEWPLCFYNLGDIKRVPGQ